MVRGLVDGIAATLDSEFHTYNNLPYSHGNSRGRRFLPGLKAGVSAPSIL
jgi:hypothetical protein